MRLMTSHRRWNPLKQEWVLISPQRWKRPWSGAVEEVSHEKIPEYDPECYLCPGNRRASGETNPEYKDVYAFDNDFSALMAPREEDAESLEHLNGIIRSKGERGICRVICFSPRHNLTLPELDLLSLRRVVDLWVEEHENLSTEPYINHVLIFENKGEMMGCSNPHPHGQIWATESIPNIPAKSLASQESYFVSNGTKLLSDYLEWELREGERIVTRNEDWVVLVPFWAVWPFETMVLPRRSVGAVTELTDNEKDAWAAILKNIAIRYDNLFKTSFPYSMAIYQNPTDGKEWAGHHLHQIFLPPLLRSATVRKFMVGFELCAEPQRDITAEGAAARLRELSTKHYKLKGKE